MSEHKRPWRSAALTADVASDPRASLDAAFGDGDTEGTWDAAAAEAWATLGATLAPVVPRSIVRDRLLRAAAGRERLSPSLRDAVASLYSLSTDDTEALVARMNRASSWLPTPLPGLSLLPLTDAELPTDLMPDGPTRLLVRIEAGSRFPRHQHLGEEQMLILQGGLTTDGGEHFGTGSCAVSLPGSVHEFVIDEGGDCIAAVRLSDGIRLS